MWGASFYFSEIFPRLCRDLYLLPALHLYHFPGRVFFLLLFTWRHLNHDLSKLNNDEIQCEWCTSSHTYTLHFLKSLRKTRSNWTCRPWKRDFKAMYYALHPAQFCRKLLCCSVCTLPWHLSYSPHPYPIRLRKRTTSVSLLWKEMKLDHFVASYLKWATKLSGNCHLQILHRCSMRT